MSKTNCFLPRKGFCLNLRVRIVKSLMAAAKMQAASHKTVGSSPFERDGDPGQGK